MLILNLRSSSINSYLSCPHRWMMEYLICISTKSNSKAAYGTAFHKVMELLNKKRWAQLNNKRVITEGDGGSKFKISELTPEKAIDWSIAYYKEKNPEFDWGPKVHKDITSWVNYTLDSSYNPALLNIHEVEYFFEYEIKEEWGRYEFEIDGEKISGQVKVRGTLDCLIKHNENYLEYLDYKTGRYLYDWKKDREKTIEELSHDPQLLLYYFSLKQLFPQFPHLGMTLFYTKGGPCPVQFGPEEYKRAEDLLKDVFTNIKNDNQAKWIYYDYDKNHQCSFCSFNKAIDEKTGKTICKKYHDEIVTLGLDKVINKYVDIKRISNYVGGGAVRTSTN